ncbi:MAG TPA: hypothetical protein VIO16_07300 [Dehalococcoidia bacterium]
MTRMMKATFAVAAVLLSGCASRNNNNNTVAGVTRITSSPKAGATAGSAVGSNSFPPVAGATATPSAAPQQGSSTASSGSSPSQQGPTSNGSPVAVTTPPPGAAASASSLNQILDQAKLLASDLPSGFSLGSLAGFQANENSVTGYDDPQAVLQLMNSTGKMGGYIQQVITPNAANGAGVSIEVWRDADGARTYFASFPKPESSIQYQMITVPGLADDVYAYQYKTNGGTGYSIAWRRGRLIIGVGEVVKLGESVDPVLQLAKLIDQKIQAVQQ